MRSSRLAHLCWITIFVAANWLAAATLIAAENRVVADLSPSADNPRNSEGAFLALKSGRLLFYYTEFYGGKSDDSPARIVSIFSDDRGATWSQAPLVVVTNRGRQNVMSVSALRLASGKLALFYLVKNGLEDCRPYVQFSTNEAQTWSAPELVVPQPGYFVLNNDRVIQSRTGRLIMPLALHRTRGPSAKNRKPAFDSRALALWYLSDDEGRTWREADTWWALPAETTTGMQEPGVVELADGNIWSWVRTDQGCQFACRSTNNGVRFSAPGPTELRSPASPASIKRLPNSNDLLAIYNDHSGKFPTPGGRKRTPLVAAISSDNGKTWPVRKLIESDPESSYCYTAIEFADDSLLLAYCAENNKEGGLGPLRIRKLSLDWLRE